jgi:hypothetical protein
VSRAVLVVKGFWNHLAELSTLEATQDVFDACTAYARDPDEKTLKRTPLQRPDDLKRVRFTIRTKADLVVVGCAGHQNEIVWEWVGTLGPEFDEKFNFGRGEGLGETRPCPPEFFTWAEYWKGHREKKAREAQGKKALVTKVHWRNNDVKTACGEDVKPGNSKPHDKGVTCEKCLDELIHLQKVRERTPEEWAKVDAASARKAAETNPYAYVRKDATSSVGNALVKHADVLLKKVEVNENEILHRRIRDLEVERDALKRRADSAENRVATVENQLAEGQKVVERLMREKADAVAAQRRDEQLVGKLSQENTDLKRELVEAREKAEKAETKVVVHKRELVPLVQPPLNGGADTLRLQAENGYLRDLVRQKDDEIMRLRVQAAQPQYLPPPPPPHYPYPAPTYGYPPHYTAPPQHPHMPPPPPPAPPQPSPAFQELLDKRKSAPEPDEDEELADDEADYFPTDPDTGQPITPETPEAKTPPSVATKKITRQAPVERRSQANGKVMTVSEETVVKILKDAKGKWVPKDDLVAALGCQPQSLAALMSKIRTGFSLDIEASKFSKDPNKPSFSAFRLKK